MGQQKIGSNLAISSPERLPERLQGCPVLQTFPTFNAQTCSNLWPLKIDWVYKCIYIYTKVQWPLQFHSLSLEFLLNFTSFSAIAPFRLCTRHTLSPKSRAMFMLGGNGWTANKSCDSRYRQQFADCIWGRRTGHVQADSFVKGPSQPEKLEAWITKTLNWRGTQTAFPSIKSSSIPIFRRVCSYQLR